MRILFFHNRYQQAGGEDNVVRAEITMLRAKGHEVGILEENNDNIVSWIDAANAAIECVYSHSAAKSARHRIDSFRPDLVHVHNFFPRLSPSIHYACHERKIPVLQTLHNYRLLCPASTFLRNGKLCEECLGLKVPWPAVKHACYQSSRLASAAVVNMLSIHRGLRTWSRVVKTFIAPTDFSRNKFIEGGLPEDRVVVKPNFVSPDPGMGNGKGRYALFVGRLSEEKGLHVLLESWKQITSDRVLKIVGDGPMTDAVREAAATIPGVEWLGPRNKKDVSRLMADAAFLIFPSICYETFGLALIEALAVGLPVIASKIGATPTLISDGETGRLFPPGDICQLAKMIDWAFLHPEIMHSMRITARSEFERKYSEEANYAILIRIYRSALDTEVEDQKLKNFALQN